MKTALIGPYPRSLGHAHGGVEAAVELLAKGLAELGTKVVVIDPFTGYSPCDDVLEGVSVVRLPPVSAIGQFGRNARRRVASSLDAVQPDIVHLHLAPQFSSLGRPCVMTVHGLPHLETRYRNPGLSGVVRSEIMKCLHKRGVRRLDHVIALSSEIRAYAQYAGVTSTLGHNPVAEGFFSASKGLREHFLSIGSVIPGKNQLGLIQAYASYVKSGGTLDLIIAGPMDDQEYVNSCREEAALIPSKVHFAGEVDRETLLSLYASTAAVLQFSFRETASLTISESLATGTPVLSTRVGNASEQIREGKNGLLIAASSDPLTAALKIHEVEGLSRSSLTFAECRESARGRDYRNVASAVIEIYHEVITDLGHDAV